MYFFIKNLKKHIGLFSIAQLLIVIGCNPLHLNQYLISIGVGLFSTTLAFVLIRSKFY